MILTQAATAHAVAPQELGTELAALRAAEIRYI